MGKKYDADQQAALTLLTDLHEQQVNQKKVIREQIAAELKARLKELQARKAEAAATAFDMGVTKTSIGHAIGTSNWTTIAELITSGEAQDAQEV